MKHRDTITIRKVSVSTPANNIRDVLSALLLHGSVRTSYIVHPPELEHTYLGYRSSLTHLPTARA